MMRELDTVSPVVWPSWCYSGEGQGDVEAASGGSEHHPQQSSAPASTTATVATAKPRGKRRAGAAVTRDNGATMNGGAGTTEHHNNNNNNNPPVKTERLSPSATSAPSAATTTATPTVAGAGNTPDNNSSSSRSATPSSSYPGTPPGGLPAERGASPSSSPAGHIKHMEQMMTRNYSDFMRSLAAKYNNANPNDYFSAPSRNGFPVGLDPRFTPFKTGATPFVGLMAPLGTGTMASPGQHKTSVAPASSVSTTTCSTTSTASPKDSSLEARKSVEAAQAQALYSCGNSMFPPLIDMSSTQALLSMVRTASAHNASQLETYLKGAIKRPPPSETSPLDLSSAALPAYGKRSRGGKTAESIFSESLLHVPMVDALRGAKKRTGSVSPKPPLRNLPSSTVTSASHLLNRNVPCLSLCAQDRVCGEAQTVAHWGVDDVCSFVSSIDICAEYAPNFREQRIDGSALPLLTEEHLTNTMGMKLGPALKLRATLSRRLGHCAICMHCVHCHAAPAVSPSQTPPAVTGRPNSTGN